MKIVHIDILIRRKAGIFWGGGYLDKIVRFSLKPFILNVFKMFSDITWH